MRKSLIIKIIAIMLLMVIGASSMCSAAPSTLSPNHGHEVINQIKERHKASGGKSNNLQALLNRARNKNNVTQTTPEVTKKQNNSKNTTKNNQIMIVSDARYFEIYDSTGDDRKVVDTLIAYKEVKILKTVGDYYKIDKGYINKKAVLTQQEFEKYSQRKGKLNYTVNKCSNASIDDIKAMTANYPNAKGLELTILICEKEYNVNAIFMVSCAILESHMGESNIGRKKNNWFGIQAYDWDPFNCAKKFDTPADCIDYWFNLISKNYIGEGRTTLKSIGKKYCSSNAWAAKIENICQRCIKDANKK